MRNSSTGKFLLGCATLIVLSFFTNCLLGFSPAHAEETAQVKTIPVKEIKKEEKADTSISLEAVEKARAITAERIYWLIGLWALLLLAIVLIRWQLRDDDKLYAEGYYSHEL